MADYQDFRARFRAQRQAVTKAQNRATQEQQIVNSQQATLWESLRKEAEQAVTQINQGGEPLLTFAGSDVGQAAGFSIRQFTRSPSATDRQRHRDSSARASRGPGA